MLLIHSGTFNNNPVNNKIHLLNFFFFNHSSRMKNNDVTTRSSMDRIPCHFDWNRWKLKLYIWQTYTFVAYNHVFREKCFVEQRVLSSLVIPDPLPCMLTARNHPRRESLKHFPDRIYRRVKSETRWASVNGIVLHVLSILGRSCGWWRWLWTVLLGCIRGATPERRDAVRASPIRRLGRVHIGSHAGNATATASAPGSRPRRALPAVQGRS